TGTGARATTSSKGSRSTVVSSYRANARRGWPDPVVERARGRPDRGAVTGPVAEASSTPDRVDTEKGEATSIGAPVRRIDHQQAITAHPTVYSNTTHPPGPSGVPT